MGRLIVDTSVLVAIERGRAKAHDYIAADDDPAIAAITGAELLVGVERADAPRRADRSRLVEAILAEFPVETYDLDVAREHARLLAHTHRTGRPRRAFDLIIAATALARDREVVTTDARGFADLPGVRVRVGSPAADRGSAAVDL